MKELAKNYIECNAKNNLLKGDITSRIVNICFDGQPANEGEVPLTFKVRIDGDSIVLYGNNGFINHNITFKYHNNAGAWLIENVSIDDSIESKSFFSCAQAIVGKLNGNDLPMPAKTLITINPNES